VKAVGINTWFQFTQGQCLCHQGQKTFWLIFCHWFGYYFASVEKINTTSLTRECSCILCPNVENFCPNNGHFFSVGDATASPASPCHTLVSYSLLKKLRLIVTGSCNSSCLERFMWDMFFKKEISENNSKKFHDQWKIE